VLLLPHLKKLSLVGSLAVTDKGLEFLSRRGGHHNTATTSTPTNNNENDLLQEIDITFCRNTTYAGTFVLRERLTNLQVLRRIPKWLEGQFHTPFGEDEVHTYWPDGTFTFNRNSQSNGFVCDVFLWDGYVSDFVGEKLQYNNFAAPLGWPEWTLLLSTRRFVVTTGG
jgi:hypothetical protein